jgi:PAC2 family
MALWRITSEIHPVRPVLIQALSGWVDAGEAATTAAGILADSATIVASFDPDALFDYRSNRPILDFEDGEIHDLRWPEIALLHASLEGRDVLLLSGMEPDLRWQEFASSVGDLATRFDVSQLISIGSVPAAVPHTLESPIMMTASDRSLLAGQRVPEGLLRVPAAAVSVVDRHFVQRGFETVGFWAQVPHYVTEPYKAAVLSLLGRLATHLGVDLSLEELRAEADEQKEHLDEIVNARPEVKAYVERLEGMASAEFRLGDQLANEVEHFLRDVGGDTPFG